MSTTIQNSLHIHVISIELKNYETNRQSTHTCTVKQNKVEKTKLSRSKNNHHLIVVFRVVFECEFYNLFLAAFLLLIWRNKSFISQKTQYVLTFLFL